MSNSSANVSREAFAARVAASALFAGDELEGVKQTILASADCKSAALQLANAKKLTRWQASQLLKGDATLTLGRYRLLDLLGQTVFGKTYLAEHSQLNRRLTLFAFDPKLAVGSVREGLIAKAQAAAALDHPSILRVSDIDHVGGQYYFVSPEIAVCDALGYVAKKGASPSSSAARFAGKIADALAAAEKAGAIHGWLCPANILFDAKERPFVVGFGFAEVLARDDQAYQKALAAASEWERVCLPPESEDVFAPSAAGDAYAIGKSLFLLATGKMPKRDELGDPDPREQFHEVGATSVADSVINVFADLTKSDPAQRLKGASVVSERLSDVAELTASSEPPSTVVVSTDSVYAAAPPPLPKASDSGRSIATAKSTNTTRTARLVTPPSGDASGVAAVESVAESSASIIVAKPSAPGKAKTASKATASKPASKVDTKAAQEATTPASPASGAADDTNGSRKLSPKRGLLVIAAASATMLLLVALTGFAVWMSQPKTKPVAKKPKAKPKTTETAKATVDAQQTASAPAKKTGGSDAPAVSAPSVDQAAEPEVKGADNPAADSPDGTRPSAKMADPLATSSEMPANPETTPPAPDPTAPNPTVPAPADPAPIPAPTPPPADPTPAPVPAPPAPTPAPPAPGPAPTTGALTEIPTEYELAAPAADNVSQPLVIGPLKIVGPAFPAVSLSGGDLVGKGNQVYQLIEDPSTPNTWQIQATGGKEKTGVAVASVAIANDQLEWTWKPDALKDASAAALRNCKLIVNVRSETKQIALRKLVAVNALTIKVDKPAPLDIPIDGLPDAKRLRLEIQTGAGIKHSKIDPGPIVEDLAKPKPTVVWIGERPEAMPFGLAVRPSVSNKGIKVEVAPVVQFNPSAEPLRYTKSAVKKWTSTIMQRIGGNQATINGNQEVPNLGEEGKPFNENRKRLREEAQRALTEAVRDDETLKSIKTVVESLEKEGQLEFRLYFVAGESQVDLARTAGFKAAAPTAPAAK